jgi:hypothetical protein
MATLIPTLGSCVWDADGERRFAYRINDKLGDEWLCWCNIPVGPLNLHPDFILLHPKYGLLVLEVKDWKKETLVGANKKTFTLRKLSWEYAADNPFVQARKNQHAVTNVLVRDKALINTSGQRQGKLLFPVTCGVVLTGITRRQFDELGLASVIGPELVICQDEMTESVSPIDFSNRLRAMFAYQFGDQLNQHQLDRVRWHLFPEIRVPQTQLDLFNETQDIEKVMDLKQEQLARSLGEGHRIIHGVAGSGKTMILSYRAEYLARATTRPILILCFNKALSKRLDQSIREKKLQAKIRVQTFHQWCWSLLNSARIPIPQKQGEDGAFYAELAALTIKSAADGRIKPAQYEAILIDEAHDFEPEWLSLVTKLLDQRTKSLLVLYDDAQSIYSKSRKKFSFKSVGIQAAGRTTILRINYRNTQEILAHTASVVHDLLVPRDSDEDGIPLISPIGGGRHGPQPSVVNFANLRDEAEFIAKKFKAAHESGIPWNNMAVIYRSYPTTGKEVLGILRQRGLPVTYHAEATFSAKEDTVKILTMHGCKGLEFRLVAIPGAGLLKLGGRDGDEDARLFYVAMTRATHELLVCRSGAA